MCSSITATDSLSGAYVLQHEAALLLKTSCLFISVGRGSPAREPRKKWRRLGQRAQAVSTLSGMTLDCSKSHETNFHPYQQREFPLLALPCLQHLALGGMDFRILPISSIK